MMQKTQQINLQVRVKASDGVFPGIELADILLKFAEEVRRRTYSGTQESEGTFLDPLGGVVWKQGDDNDRTSSSAAEKG